MVYCIATDEAGYGPRLGPLVISATVWELPEGISPGAMYEELSGLIVPKKPPSCGRSNISKGFPPVQSPVNGPSACPRCGRSNISKGFPRLVVGDSKAVFDRRRGLCVLEETVFSMLAVAGKSAKDWTELIAHLAFDAESRESAWAWYADHWPTVPERLSHEEIAGLAEWLRSGMSERGIQLLSLRSVIFFPERYNRLLAQYDNKATLLSWETLKLVQGLAAELPLGSVERSWNTDLEPVQVFCDKHGGRDRYATLLSEKFSTDFFQPIQVHTLQESRQESIYRVPSDQGSMVFHFVCGGEILLPVALASMVSKYVRELAMAAWNEFWTCQVPGLAPTAGYPEDAKRFCAAIADRQAELNIPHSAIWRMR